MNNDNQIKNTSNWFKKIWNWHEKIGKVLTITCLIMAMAAIIGLFTGTTIILQKEKTVITNHFINEEVSFHNENYSLIVHNVYSEKDIKIIDRGGNTETKSGNYICVCLTINQESTSALKTHKIDADDFKLKDHTGIYLPLNNVLGAVGWDGIDIHYDDAEGGFVISSAEFETEKSIKDYSYIDKEISPGISLDTTVIFEMNSELDPQKNLLVLEVDFYYFKKGIDIILLPRPTTEE